MRLVGRFRRLLVFVTLYLGFCSVGAMCVANATLHPARGPLTPEATTIGHEIAAHLDSEITDVSITTPDNVILRAWSIHPHHANGDDVILLHGLGDNRLGMAGYAQ